MLFYTFNIRCYHQQIAKLHCVPFIARKVAITMTITIMTVIARHEAISSRMQLPSTDCHASLLFARNDGHEGDSVIARHEAISSRMHRNPIARIFLFYLLSILGTECNSALSNTRYLLHICAIWVLSLRGTKQSHLACSYHQQIATLRCSSLAMTGTRGIPSLRGTKQSHLAFSYHQQIATLRCSSLAMTVTIGTVIARHEAISS